MYVQVEDLVGSLQQQASSVQEGSPSKAELPSLSSTSSTNELQQQIGQLQEQYRELKSQYDNLADAVSANNHLAQTADSAAQHGQHDKVADIYDRLQKCEQHLHQLQVGVDTATSTANLSSVHAEQAAQQVCQCYAKLTVAWCTRSMLGMSDMHTIVDSMQRDGIIRNCDRCHLHPVR